MTQYILDSNDLPTKSGVFQLGDTIILQDGTVWGYHPENGFTQGNPAALDALGYVKATKTVPGWQSDARL